MKTYWIKQSINIALMVFLYIVMYGNLKQERYAQAIINVMLFNVLFTVICTEKKPK